jgi:hypothetical protein
MGGTTSKIASETPIESNEHGDYFVKDFLQLNQTINDILTTSKTFKNNNILNSLLKKRCDRVILSSEHKLDKYSKIHLNNLHTSISLIPKKEFIKDKKFLCKQISEHFSKVLQVLLLIKYVYDVENFGAFNIAGIVDKNIKQTKSNIKIKFCNTSQPENDILDMSQLSGFDFFVSNFLTSKERQSFSKVFQDIFNLKNVSNIDEMVCIRRIFEDDIDNIIFAQNSACDPSKTKNNFNHLSNEKKHFGSIMKIHPKNPILSWKYCNDFTELKCKKTKEMRTHLTELQTNYMKNLQKTLDILNELVTFNKDTSQFQLKNISHEKLSITEKRIKQNIIQFYIKSIVDYKNVLQCCKS